MTGSTRRRLAVGGPLVAAAVALSACGSGAALGLARTACSHVDRSIRLYDASLHAASPAEAGAEQAAAVAQLEAAQPDAATAAGEDAQWQALMTTVAESPRTPEGYLVYALQQQCDLADSQGGDTYVGPSTPDAGVPGSSPSTTATGSGAGTAPAAPSGTSPSATATASGDGSGGTSTSDASGASPSATS